MSTILPHRQAPPPKPQDSGFDLGEFFSHALVNLGGALLAPVTGGASLLPGMVYSAAQAATPKEQPQPQPQQAGRRGIVQPDRRPLAMPAMASSGQRPGPYVPRIDVPNPYAIDRLIEHYGINKELQRSLQPKPKYTGPPGGFLAYTGEPGF